MGPAKFVALCFAVFAAFGAGYYYQGISDTEPFLAYAKSPVAEEECEVAGPPVVSANDYCAILTMPRTLVPFLERLKRNKLASDVVITPATIRQENGQITAVAKVSPKAEKTAGQVRSDEPQVQGSGQKRVEGPVLGALAVYFLAGSKKSGSP